MPSYRRVTTCAHRPTARPGRTTAAVLAAGASLALVTGCASATGGASNAAAGAGGAVPAAATSAAPTADLTGLAARVATAVAAARSVHLTADLSSVTALPVPVGTVEGDLAFSGGKPTAADVTANGFGLRFVDDTAWVDLSGAATARWTLVSTTSSNPIVAAAAGKLADLRSTLAGVDPAALLGAAGDLRDEGPGTAGGTAATRYTFTVDPATLATALGVDPDGRAASLGPVPVQLWLDSANRPVRVTATPTVDGRATPLTVTLSAWDAPVSITAPDPATVTK